MEKIYDLRQGWKAAWSNRGMASEHLIISSGNAIVVLHKKSINTLRDILKQGQK